ncbi:hypothetical protein RND81_08G137900 [Saponaria officinalis]|uniref:RING-type domain-containing protein n=1 Tax=Saponaria officinalis TaxID=3572 RepID=A0AAW1J725_SAPOF
MAVQAQYPSNILLFNRNMQESKNIILEQQPCDGDFMFFNNGGGLNPRKRSREIPTTATHTTTTATTVDSFNFSLQNQQHNQNQQQNQNHQLIDLSQQQQQQHPSFVSTGLKLSFGDQNQQQQQQKQQQIQQHPAILSLFSDELVFQFKQQSDELNYFLHAQGEQLRRTLAEKRQRHYNALLRSAEATIARRVREKEVELNTVARRNAELEARAAQLSSEAQVWQARAQAQEAQAVSLQAQIQQAMIGPGPGPNNVGGPLQSEREDAEDAESVYNDPVNETRAKSPSCKACRTRDASVVLLPCRHLCVCVQCDEIVQACPLCFSLRSASVEVYLT